MASVAPSWIFQRCLFLANAHTLHAQIDPLGEDRRPLAPPQAEGPSSAGLYSYLTVRNSKEASGWAISLIPVVDSDLELYKYDMQEAFQRGYEDVLGPTNEVILPEEDIDCSLNTAGAAAYHAVLDGERVGGAIVVIDPVTQKIT